MRISDWSSACALPIYEDVERQPARDGDLLQRVPEHAFQRQRGAVSGDLHRALADRLAGPPKVGGRRRPVVAHFWRRGPSMASGRTPASNWAAVRRPSATAPSCRHEFAGSAFLAPLAQLL